MYIKRNTFTEITDLARIQIDKQNYLNSLKFHKNYSLWFIEFL